MLRLLRLLKMMSGITELNTVMKSISTSAICLLYVIFLMLIFFYFFGVVGVYLFSVNDPEHFKHVGRAILTLFQVRNKILIAFLLCCISCVEAFLLFSITFNCDLVCFFD